VTGTLFIQLRGKEKKSDTQNYCGQAAQQRIGSIAGNREYIPVHTELYRGIMILNMAAVSMAAAGAPGNFSHWDNNPGDGNMCALVPAGMMFVCQGERIHRFGLPVGRAPGMQKGMMMRLNVSMPVNGDAGNKTRRSYCREPQGAQQHTITHTLFHI
jgi:hypothetical protein